MKKAIIPIIIVVVIALGVLILNLGSASKGIIEKLASDALKTKVTIGKMDISLVDKSVVISNVTIQNPKGFKAKNLLEVAKIDVKASDLMGDTISIDYIKVTGLNAAYEVNTSGTNVNVIKKNLKETSASKQNQSSSSTHKEIAIKQLEITNSNATAYIADHKKEIALPPIKIFNIGTKTRPVLPSKAIATVINKIMTTVSSSASKGIAKEKAGKLLEKMDGKLKDLF